MKVATIFACYRKDEAHNPDMYAAAVTAVLSDFPRDVIDYVIDPRTGILGTLKFLPTVAEIKEACEYAHNRILQQQERERRTQKQLADRDADRIDDPDRAARRKIIADAWLNRADPRAQELSGQKPKKPPTQQEIDALLNNAHDVGRSISGMKLLPETLAAMRSMDAAKES